MFEELFQRPADRRFERVARADEEFPSNVRVLYSGENIKKIRGEDLVELTVACLNHMLRYVKETVENPPEICSRV